MKTVRTYIEIDKKLWNRFKDFAKDEGMTLKHCHELAIKRMLFEDTYEINKLRSLKASLESDIKIIKDWIENNREKLKISGFDEILQLDIPF